MVEHYSIPALDEKHFPVFEIAAGIKSNKYRLTKESGGHFVYRIILCALSNSLFLKPARKPIKTMYIQYWIVRHLVIIYAQMSLELREVVKEQYRKQHFYLN